MTISETKHVIAACGHTVIMRNLPRRPYAIKRVIDGVHTISWKAVCKKCYKDLLERGDILLTTKQQEEWLSSGKKVKPDRSTG